MKCFLDPASSDPVPQLSDQALQLALVTIEADLDLRREGIRGVLGYMGEEDASVSVDRDEQLLRTKARLKDWNRKTGWNMKQTVLKIEY